MISTSRTPTRRRAELKPRCREVDDDIEYANQFNQNLIDALLEKIQLIE